MTGYIKVVCAIANADDADGKILIARRPLNKSRGGLWEFPGGKVRSGETAENALKREIFEELHVEIVKSELLGKIFHDYPELSIELIAYGCLIDPSAIVLKEHSDFVFLNTGELLSVDLCEADKLLISLLISCGKVSVD